MAGGGSVVKLKGKIEKHTSDNIRRKNLKKLELQRRRLAIF